MRYTSVLLMWVLLSLSLGALPAATQECVTIGGCTGDVSGAGMCGISTDPIETGPFCSLNNCQEPKITQGPRLEVEVVPVRRRQNPLFKVRIVAEVETPWNIWARDNNVNGSIQALWMETVPGEIPFNRLSVCYSTMADKHKVSLEKTMTCAQMRATRDQGGTNTSILKYYLGLGACGPPCDPNDPIIECPTHPCHRWKVKKDIPLSVPDDMLEQYCPLKDDPCSDQQDPNNSGPGAYLRYTRGGVGGDSPGSASWNAELGRFWSHDYAVRLVEDPDNPDHAFLITAEAIYREFWDFEGDGVFDQVSPTDAVAGLRRDAGGFALSDFDGTTQRFDSGGRWTETSDRDGNAIRGSYVGGRLSEVAFPDGRAERFAYGVDGKLESITEVGVDGVTTRQWRYFWNGLDLERIERPDGTATLMRYDDPAHPGYLTRRTLRGTDGSERIEQAWSYDAYGNIAQTWKGAVTPQQGVEVMTYSYPDPWNPTERQIVDALGQESTVSYRRDPGSNVALVTAITGGCPTCEGAPNGTRSYGDSAHPTRITRSEDGAGNVTLMSYDAQGQVITQTEAAGTPFERTTRWQYDPDYPGLAVSKEVPSTSGAGVRRVTWSRVGGRVVSETEAGIENGSPFSLTRATTYNAAGRVESVDPPGFGTQDVTSFTYHADRGHLLLKSRTAPGRGTTTFDYDAFNRLTRLTDAHGVVTEIAYDELDRPLTEVVRGATPAEDLVRTFTYTPFGDLHRILQPRGNIVERGYDAFGRWVSTERKPDAATPGERTLQTLDDVGRRIREELQSWTGSGWQTEASRDFIFESPCQLEKIVYADGTAEELAYDCAGRLAGEWDANHSRAAGHPASRTYTYDALGRVSSLTVPWGGGGGQQVTTYAYDSQDNLAQVVDPAGTVTGFVYGDRHLLTSRVSEVSGVTQRFYNEHGALVREVDGRQIEVGFAVDAADRVTQVDYSDDRLDVTYVYDDPATPFSIGRLSSVSRDGETISYAYDRLGRRTRDGDLIRTYDANGNLETLTYPGGVVATYSYDFADRPLALSLQDGAAAARSVASAASYPPFGPLSALTLGNGLREDRPVDSRYRTVGIGVGGVLDWSLTRDGMANVTAITDHLEPAASRTFVYQDHQYFLRDASGPWGSLIWDYDASGNRTRETRGARVELYSYAPNAAGVPALRLASITAQGAAEPERRFHYDVAGNLTQVLTSGGKTSYTYDVAGRMARLRSDGADTPVVTDFSYDGRGFLDVSRRTLAAAEWRSVATYDSEGRLYHRAVERPLDAASGRDDGARVGDDYVLYFEDRPVALYSRQTTSRPGAPPESQTSLVFLTTDAAGAPVLVTGESGEVLWKGTFEPFGAGFGGTGDITLFLRLPGQWADAAWDGGADRLSYNVHRWYDPSIGRYLRPDPMEFFLQDDVSAPLPYLYTGNNPVRDSDPFGLYVATGSDAFRGRVDTAIEDIRDAIRRRKGECCTQYFADRGVNLAADLEAGGKPFIREATGSKLAAMKKKGACGTASTQSPFIHVWVNPDCFGPIDACGFASNIIHEMGHLARKDTTDNEPSDFFRLCNFGCVNAGAYR